jgi:hypothetical protein
MKYTVIHLVTTMYGSNRGTRTEIDRIETKEGGSLTDALKSYGGNIVCVFEGWPKYAGEE